MEVTIRNRLGQQLKSNSFWLLIMSVLGWISLKDWTRFRFQNPKFWFQNPKFRFQNLPIP